MYDDDDDAMMWLPIPDSQDNENPLYFIVFPFWLYGFNVGRARSKGIEITSLDDGKIDGRRCSKFK